jgi:hypothetical protein
VDHFDPPLSKIPGDAEILAILLAGEAVCMGTGPAHTWHNKVTHLQLLNSVPDFDDLSESFMA